MSTPLHEARKALNEVKEKAGAAGAEVREARARMIAEMIKSLNTLHLGHVAGLDLDDLVPLADGINAIHDNAIKARERLAENLEKHAGGTGEAAARILRAMNMAASPVFFTGGYASKPDEMFVGAQTLGGIAALPKKPGWEAAEHTPDGGAKSVFGGLDLQSEGLRRELLLKLRVRLVPETEVEFVSDREGTETITLVSGVDEDASPDFDTVDPDDIQAGDHVEWHDDCGVHRWEVKSVSDWTGTKTGVILQSLHAPLYATQHVKLPLPGDPFILRPRS